MRREPEMQQFLNGFLKKTVGRDYNDPGCVMCGWQKVEREDFDNELAWREYKISRMCQRCQDKTFHVDTLILETEEDGIVLTKEEKTDRALKYLTDCNKAVVDFPYKCKIGNTTEHYLRTAVLSHLETTFHLNEKESRHILNTYIKLAEW